MSIRFTCPSCQQPIEVDDPWGGKTVGCPYCHHAVNAPASSTWPQQGVPMATPIGPAPTTPPSPALPPLPQSPPPRAGASAIWAFLISLVSAALCVLGFAFYMIRAMEALVASGFDLSNPNSEQQARETFRKMAEAGQLPASPEATITLLVGIVLAIIALIMAIRSMVRGEGYRTLAVFSVLISLAFLSCQGMLTLFMLSASRM